MKSVVVSNPEILSGTPVFAGTRVPVKNLTDCLEGGSTIDGFLDDFFRYSCAGCGLLERR